MKPATTGDKVTIEFEGKLDDGKVVAEATQADPLRFTLGQKEVFPEVEKAVEGMRPGEMTTVNVSGRESFGERDPSKVIEVDRALFPLDQECAVGVVVRLNRDDKLPKTGRIVEVGESVIKVDCNHPFADKEIIFDLKLLEVA